MKLTSVLLLAALIFAGCSKSDNSSSPSADSQTDFSVYLTDGPGKYDEVNIDIEQVEVHFSDDANDDTWHEIKMVHPGIHNLLKLANGKDTLLASDRIAAKKITQIRLILGNDNTVVVNCVSYPLETPSAQESGLKLNVDAQLTAGVEYKVWTDFDAEKSIVETGNGKYMLKPVIRVYTKAISGSVSGIILPVVANSTVYIMQGGDTIATAIPDPVTGYFEVDGLADGNYTVVVDADSDYVDVTINSVPVVIDAVKNIGTITLLQ